MKEADCKDKYCILMGTINDPGENIVCLPNRLIVKIVSDKPNENILDAVN